MDNYFIAELAGENYLNFMEYGKQRPSLLAFSDKETITRYLHEIGIKQCAVLGVSMEQLIEMAMSAGVDVIIDRDAKGKLPCLHIDVARMKRDIQKKRLLRNSLN